MGRLSELDEVERSAVEDPEKLRWAYRQLQGQYESAHSSRMHAEKCVLRLEDEVTAATERITALQGEVGGLVEVLDKLLASIYGADWRRLKWKEGEHEEAQVAARTICLIEESARGAGGGS